MRKYGKKIMLFQLMCVFVSLINPIAINASSMVKEPQYDHNTSLDYEELYVEENHVIDNDPNTINDLLTLVPELNPYYIKNGEKVYVKDSDYNIENLILTPTSFNISKGMPNTIEITMNLLYITPEQNYVFKDSDKNVTATLTVGNNPFVIFDYSHTRFKKGQYVGNNLAEIYGAHAYHFVNGKVEEIDINHISETSELDGYTPGLKHVYFQVESDGQTTNEYTSIEVVEELTIKSEIKLHKIDENGNPLAGAVFEVKDSNGNVIDPGITTDENGNGSIIVNKLGDYTITEVKAPTGYELTNPVYSEVVTIDDGNQVIMLNGGNGIVNTKIKQGQIDLFKVDQDGKALSGAEFTVYDNKGKIVEVLTTNDKGYAITKSLPLGTYTVKETKAPSGYELNRSEFTVEINEDNQVVHVNEGNGIVNNKIKTITPEKPLVPNVELPIVEAREGLIDLLKVDQDGKALSGAEFTVYDNNGKIVEVLTTDDKGYAITNALPLGTYTIKETKAPSGYELNHTEYKVEIHETGQLVHVNEGNGIVNNKITTITPEKPLKPDNNLPEVTKPDNNLPEVTKPDNNLPEVTKPDNNLPEVTKPDNNLPEVTKPDNNLPEVTKPANNLPEVTKPANNLPEVTKPDNNLPEVTKPYNKLPEVTKPANNLPEVIKPDNNLPNEPKSDNNLSEEIKSDEVDKKNNDKLQNTGMKYNSKILILGLIILSGLIFIRLKRS